MSLIDGTTLATDLFRISYQGIEAACDQTTPLTVSERITQTMKRHIALTDTFFCVGQYLFAHDSLKEWIIPLRLFSIGSGLYQLQSSRPADNTALWDMIFLNLLNISSVATRTLNPQISAGFLLIDASYRVFKIVDQRTALADRIKELSHQIDFQQIKEEVCKGLSYLGCTAMVALTVYACYLRGMTDLQFATRLSTNTLHEIVSWTLAGSTLAPVIGLAVHHIFTQMGMSASRTLIMMEVAIAGISSALLMGLSAVGIGRVSSLSALYKPIFPAACTLVLGCLLWKVFRIAIHEIFDQMGVQTNTLRTLQECAITALGAIPLTILTTVGMGISKTIPDALGLSGKIAAIGLIAIPCISCSAVLFGRTLFLGIPSMDEMAAWHNDLNKAPAKILNALFG